MIKIYVSPSCSSCRKVKHWFDEQGIPYIEKNIFGPSLNEKDIIEILSKSENGTDDIISPRSNVVKENNIDLDKITTLELLKFIKDNPSCLKRPIIVDDRRIQVGYNEEEILTFIPQAKRLAEFSCSKDTCANYANCPHIKDKVNA